MRTIILRQLRRALVVASVLCTFAATAQINFDEVAFKTTEIGPDIYLLQGAGGNLALLVGDDGSLLVDADYGEVAGKLGGAVEAVTDKPLRYVINTHWHFDHTGGNEAVAQTGAVIIAHDNVRVRMSRDERIGLLNLDIPASPEQALPNQTFKQQMTLHFAGQTITAQHVSRAHSDGDAFVHFAEANIIHGGDLFWNGLYPFVDTSSGGGIDGLIKGVKRMLALADEDTKIIPGHGPLGTREDLKAYLDMLEATRSRVLKLIEDRVPRGQVQFKPVLKDYDDKWGNGFMSSERYLLIVYDDLYRK